MHGTLGTIQPSRIKSAIATREIAPPAETPAEMHERIKAEHEHDLTEMAKHHGMLQGNARLIPFHNQITPER